MPSVDIVVNNHNYGRYLAAAIRSALDQTHERVTVIVVDDGSTDESREVIASFGERIVPVLKENGGQASAFNAGLGRCRGDVVIFLDSDDQLEARTAERVALAFAESPGLAKVHFRLAVVDAEGRPTGEVNPPGHIALPKGDLRRAMIRFPFDMARPPTSGNAFAADVLRRIAPVPPTGRTAADWYVVNLAPLYGPVEAIDEPLGFYRVHGENSYSIASDLLDLEHVHATVERTRLARGYLEAAAVQLGLPWDSRDASMCEIADRAISRKLDPAAHPISTDTVPGLLIRGTRAAARRFDMSIALRTAFVVWLALLAGAPRPLARRLAGWFLYPELRHHLLRTLGLESWRR